MISTTNDLRDLCERARKSGVVALDTEFVWTKTCYPTLGLIQLGLSRDDCHLLDAPALDDVTPFGELLADPGTVKILHDASGDLAILCRLTGRTPANIFDTRLAAGFSGLSSTLSLGDLLKELLDVDLPKTESRSNWMQRPLTPPQLEYAIDDIRYMLEARETLLQRADDCGTTRWLEEELRTFDRPVLYREDDPNECYRKITGMGRLNSRQLALLRELAAWREGVARREDQARPRVVRDEQLVAIAEACPTSLQELRRVRGVWRSISKKYGEEMFAAVTRGLETPDERCPRPPSCPIMPRLLKTYADRVLALVRRRATAHNVDPLLVSARRDASSFVLGIVRQRVDHHPLLSTWRREVLGNDIDELQATIAVEVQEHILEGTPS